MTKLPDRARLLNRARLASSLLGAASAIILGWVIEPANVPWIAAIAAVQVLVNQPFTLGPVLSFLGLRLRIKTLLRIHLIFDIVILTLVLHCLGGYRGGPLIATYLLVNLFAAASLGWKDGIWTSAFSAMNFFLMTVYEMAWMATPPPALDLDHLTFAATMVAVAITLAIFTLPALIGNEINQVISRQETEVQKSLERYRRLLKEMGEALIVVNPDGTIHEANPKAAELFRRPLESLPGRPFIEILTPESADDFAVLIQNVAGGEPVAGKNWRMPLPDGGERVVEVNASPYPRDPDPPAVFIILRDVTERLRLEAELKRYSEELELRVERRTAELEASREIYQSLFEKAAAPLAWLDRDGVLQSANRVFYALTGLDPTAEETFPIVNLALNPAERDWATKTLELHRKGYEAPSRLELPIRRPDGQVRFTEWLLHFDPLTDQLLLSMIDVTERKRAEDALRESEERYRALIQTSPDAITVTDLEARIVMVNQKTIELYGGESEADLIGKNSFELIVPADRDRAGQNALKTLKDGSVHGAEYRFLRKDGSFYHGELSAAVIRDAKGAPATFIGVVRDVSARKRAADALRESEERLRALIEAVPDPIILTGMDGRIQMVNHQALKFHGAEAEAEMVGKYIFDMIGAEDRELAIENSRLALKQTGVLRNQEYTLLKRDGSPYAGEINSTVIRDEAGEPTGFVSVIRDVTERRQAEDALAQYRETLEAEVKDRTAELEGALAQLRENEEKYRMLFMSSPDMIALIGLDGAILDINKNTTSINDLSREQIIGRSFLDFSPLKLDDRPELSQIFNRLLQGVVPGPIEISLSPEDQPPIWLEIFPALIKKDGELKAIQVITRDITERKLAEHALRESERRYRLLAENVTDVIWTANFHELKATYISPSIEALRGFTSQEVLGQTLEEIYAPASLEKIRAVLTAELAQEGKEGVDPNRIIILELEYLCKDESTVWVEEKMTFLRDPKGAPVGILGVTRDITKRKAAEAELERYRDRLEEQVELRTAELQETNHQLLEEIAERIKAERALKESESRLAAAIDNLPFDFFMIGPTGEYIMENAYLRTVYGEIVGKRPEEMTTDEETAQLWLGNNRRAFAGEVVKEESVFTVKGAKRYYYNIVAPVYYGDEIREIMGLNIDLTEQKRAEEALKKSEERFRSLIENSLDVISIIGRDGKTLFESASVEKVLGFKPEEIVGKNAFDMVHPDSRPALGQRFADGMANPGGVAHFEFKTRHRDGSWRLMDVVAKNMLDDPDIGGFIINSRDVTQRKAAEDALRASEAKLRSFLDNSPDSIATLDRKGVITYLNRPLPPPMAAAKVGDKIIDVMPPAFQDQAASFGAEMFAGKRKPFTHFVELLDRWYELRLVPLPVDERVEAVMVIGRDITERIEMEKARDQLTQQLSEAERMAAVGQVAAGVAHQMNSPLTAISYYADSLTRLEELKDKEREKVKRVKESADRIQGLMTRLLDYASTKKPEREPVAVSDLVRQALDAINFEFEQRPDITCRLELEEPLPTLIANSSQIIDLVTNLVINAVQAIAPRRPGLITVGVRRQRQHLIITVRDNGLGIAPDALPQIFDPFMSKGKKGKGVGLGLAIVKKVVDQHQGKITVESVAGEGAAFTVLLPLGGSLKP